MLQINREGYNERSTKAMLEKPVTELSKLIGAKWFLPLDQLAVRCGVAKKWVVQAIRGGKIAPKTEQRIRDALERL